MGVIRTLRSVIRFRAFEWSSIARRLARAADVGDLRRIAKRRLPAGVFDYIDGAAEDELTLRRNRAAYQRLEFRPRVLRDVSVVDPRTSLLGRVIPFPLVLAPTGFTRIADPQGELAVARAAERAGIPYTLSTLSTRSIEEVSGVSRGSLWFQVYVWKDRGWSSLGLQSPVWERYHTRDSSKWLWNRRGRGLDADTWPDSRFARRRDARRRSVHRI